MAENGWLEYKRDVMRRLDEYGDRLDRIDESVNQILIGFSGLKVKVSLLIGVAALVASVITRAFFG